jgi:hypothetical protein
MLYSLVRPISVGTNFSDFHHLVAVVAMHKFVASCTEFRDYPKNLTQHSALTHSTAGYFDRLKTQSKDLFRDVQDKKVAVDFLDYNEADHRKQPIASRSLIF